MDRLESYEDICNKIIKNSGNCSGNLCSKCPFMKETHLYCLTFASSMYNCSIYSEDINKYRQQLAEDYLNDLIIFEEL